MSVFSRKVAAELAPNEPERVSALASLSILDSPPEAPYDDLTAFACRAFDVPVSQVSLVDARRQFIKSAAGTARVDTPREHSFCAHAVANNSTLVVPDARVDSRFRDNPLVVGQPHIRFYAGALLIVRNGLCMGTLCLISPQKGTGFGAQQVLLLEKLARVAAELMEGRTAKAALPLLPQRTLLHASDAVPKTHYLLVDENLTVLYVSEHLHLLPGLEEFLPGVREPDLVELGGCSDLVDLIDSAQELQAYCSQRFRVDDFFLDVEAYPIGGRTAVLLRDISAAYREEDQEERLRLVLKATCPLIWTLRPSSPREDHLREWLEFTGQTFDDFSVNGFATAVHPEDVAHCERAFALGSEEANAVVRVRRFDGMWRWMQVHVIPRVESDRSIREWIGVVSDVTDRYELEAEVRQANERYALATEATSEAILDVDCLSGRTYYSQRWGALLEYEAMPTKGTLNDLLARMHPEDRERFRAASALLEEGSSNVLQMEARCKSSRQDWLWIAIHAVVRRDAKGKLIRLTGAASDITVRKTGDVLTGLLNRSTMVDAIQYRMDEPTETHRNFGVFFVDLDFFKRINDSMGHEMGDALLVAVAERLRETVHNGKQDRAARVGGDEFVILVSDLNDVADALTYASMLDYILSAPFHIRGRAIHVSTSIGIAFSDAPGQEDAEAILSQADIAMYCAKQEGRSRYLLFSPSMKQQAIERVDLEQDLRGALRHKQLTLHYQPKMDVKTETCIGFEALLRWRHPARGIIGPADFIPIAEEAGLIVAIGTWMFQEALTQLKRWRAQGLVSKTMTMAVNVSAQQLQQQAFCRTLLSMCSVTDVPPEALVLEVTESVFLGDTLLITSTLAQLAAAGFGLELDDFGTGYSSLSYLHKHPFHRVKIDRSFVGNMETNQRSLSLVSTIVGMAHALGMGVVAEGVETPEQLNILRELGCKHAQGYLFSPALSVQQLEAGWIGAMRR